LAKSSKTRRSILAENHVKEKIPSNQGLTSRGKVYTRGKCNYPARKAVSNYGKEVDQNIAQKEFSPRKKSSPRQEGGAPVQEKRCRSEQGVPPKIPTSAEPIQTTSLAEDL